MDIKYQVSSGMPTMTPTSYNVQPSRTAERAAQKLEQAFTKLGSFVEQYDKDTYNKKALDQNNKIAAFDAQFQSSSYEAQQEMLKFLPEMVLQGTEGDDTYSMQLRNNGNQAIAKYQGIVGKAAVQGDQLYKINEDTRGAIDYQTRFNEATTLADKAKIAEEFKITYVDPLAESKDPFDQKRWATNVARHTQLTDATFKISKIKADNVISNEAYTFISDAIVFDGELSADNRALVIDKLKGLSDWETKSTEYLEKIDKQVLLSMRSVFSEEYGIDLTRENVEEYQAKLARYYNQVPTLEGKTYYNEAVNFGNQKLKTVNQLDINNFFAMARSESVPLKALEEESKRLLDLKVLSPERVTEGLDHKKSVINNVSQKVKLKAALDTNSPEGFAAIKEAYLLGQGESVKSVLNADLVTLFGEQSRANGLTAALEMVGQRIQQFKQYDLPFGKIDQVEAILAYPSTGFENNDQVAEYLATYASMRQAGYSSGALAGNNFATFETLKQLAKMGVQDIATTYKDAQNNPKPKAADVQEMVDAILGKNEWFSTELNTESHTKIGNTIKPAVAMLMQAGLDPSQLEDFAEGFVESHYFTVDKFWKYDDKAMIPRLGFIENEDVYTNIQEKIAQYPNVGSGALMRPVDSENPNTDWIALGTNGGVQKFTNAEMRRIAQGQNVIPQNELKYQPASVAPQTAPTAPTAPNEVPPNATIAPNNGAQVPEDDISEGIANGGVQPQVNAAVPQGNEVIDNVYNKLIEFEGASGDTVTGIPTGEKGLTTAEYDRIKKQYGNMTQAEASKVYLGEQLDILETDFTGFKDLTNAQKQGILDVAYNLRNGAEKMKKFSHFKHYLREGDVPAAMKELLETAQSNGKSMLGLAKRRAESWNTAFPYTARNRDMKIRDVEVLEDGTVIYYRDKATNDIIHEYKPKGGRHEKSSFIKRL